MPDDEDDAGQHQQDPVGEGHVRLLQPPSNRVLPQSRVDPRQIGRVVATETEDRVSIVAVVLFEGLFARVDLLVQPIGMGQGVELSMRIDRQREKQDQRDQRAEPRP